MKIKKISRGEMPPANKYVLIRLKAAPWIDHSDQSNVLWKVAKCIYGISIEERQELKKKGFHRANIYKTGDEWGNNAKPYEFKEFGPGTYFGQDVDVWCELPSLTKTEE